ncbi:hypothetical protein GPECTOR_3g105 [Gonium pectorale]|uniref:RNA 3'-terminal phosphate cyclase n=1 Tax=Gonium pectorale TaxID=33097 RepID=A0A150GYQ6_GONPE|nr:hypothetical protein GPECTOR_3g105 [Gonium pectorale]|eukprot:KXZ54935.1 hypothetical protein GPECTOR_3g105 [Gonium pectorale]
MKTIDGSMLEGGGQILRYSAALSAITGTPVAVEKVRAKRSKPGLQPQHLTGLQLVERICRGELQGGAVGSANISLRPGAAVCGRYSADTRTAGSCTLMVQQIPIRRSFSELELLGGTDADMAPPAGYLADVLAPLLRRLYGDLMEGLDVQIVRRGFYPRGGGILTARVPSLPRGTSLPPLDLTTRGNITQVTIKSFAAGRVPATVPQRLAASAEAVIRRTLRGLGPAGRSAPILVEAVLEPPDRAFGDGCGVLIIADTDTGCRLGASAKGERGVPAEQIGERAAEELAEALESGTCVDQWMQDQLIIWMALASGVSRMRCCEPSLHTRTAMVVAETLLPGVKFTLHRPAPARGAARRGSGGKGGKGKAGGGEADGGAGSTPEEAQLTVTADGAADELWLVECRGAGWAAGRA